VATAGEHFHAINDSGRKERSTSERTAGEQFNTSDKSFIKKNPTQVITGARSTAAT
jgi:hypothetical protein